MRDLAELRRTIEVADTETQDAARQARALLNDAEDGDPLSYEEEKEVYALGCIARITRIRAENLVKGLFFMAGLDPEKMEVLLKDT